MNNRNQKQIMQPWSEEASCLVSIICTTYNHENYIGDAIDGFLMQETSFPFEILIHDDASTDATAKIIAEYQSLFPDLIRPIFQTENQLSKGNFKPILYTSGYARGRYIAVCEGDDYWICNKKLQIQVDAMLAHSEIEISCHSAYRLRGQLRDKEPINSYGKNQILPPGFTQKRMGTIAPTASYMIRREVFRTIPDWVLSKSPAGDYVLEMYGSKRGVTLYIHKPMCVYRYDVANSWTSEDAKDISKRRANRERLLECYDLMEPDFLGREYEEYFQVKRAATLYNLAICNVIEHLDQQFILEIERSVELILYSRKQDLLYRARKFPTVIRFLLAVYNRHIKRDKKLPISSILGTDQ